MNFHVYHFHLYYDHDQIPLATSIAHEMGRRFNVPVGRVWDRQVGPHPTNSCQITVPRGQFEEVLLWLMENRQGLDVFIHPEGEDELVAHRDHAMWLGKSYPIKLEIFS